jgi:hypothetical protein
MVEDRKYRPYPNMKSYDDDLGTKWKMDHFRLNKMEYLQSYLYDKIHLPAELGDEFVKFVYMKHDDYNQDLLMEELKKAMRIHMHLYGERKKNQKELDMLR